MKFEFVCAFIVSIAICILSLNLFDSTRRCQKKGRHNQEIVTTARIEASLTSNLAFLKDCFEIRKSAKGVLAIALSSYLKTWVSR